MHGTFRRHDDYATTMPTYNFAIPFIFLSYANQQIDECALQQQFFRTSRAVKNFTTAMHLQYKLQMQDCCLNA